MLPDLSQLPPSFMAVFFPIVLLCVIISLWGIVHAFYREFPTVNEKLIWLALVVFVPFVGGLTYLFIGRKRGRKYS